MPRRTPLTLALLLTCAGLARAQDDELLPAERAQREAAARALASAREVWGALEAYGRGGPAPEPDLRARGVTRLLHDPDAPDQEQEVQPPDPPEVVADQLDALRADVLRRLHRLEPDAGWLDEKPAPPEPPLTLRIVSVQDLCLTESDHEAPPVGLGANEREAVSIRGGGGGVLTFCDAGGPSGPSEYLDADKIVELLEGELGRAGFEGGTIEYSAGRLLVRKPPEAHALVERLLTQLRAPRAGLVDLDIRLYRLPAALWNELRPEALALSPEAEGRLSRAERDGSVQRLAAHRLVGHDGQRVVVRRGQTRAMVVDVEINQTGVVPVPNPVVRAIVEGLAVEVRPVIDRVRGQALIDVAVSLGKLGAKNEARTYEGFELELPEMALTRSTSTAAVPLGRGALLGGGLVTDGAPGGPIVMVYVRPQLIQGKR